MLSCLRLLRRYPFALASTVGIVSSLALGGCGDEAGDSGPQVVFEVQAPESREGTTIAALDYEIACDTGWDTVDAAGSFTPATLRDGTLELIGPTVTSSGTEAPNFKSWSATEAPLDGLCLLHLIARDEQQRPLCVGTETFEAAESESILIETLLDCTEFAAFVGDVSLKAEVPEVGVETLQTVEFTIGCSALGTAFFEGMADAKSQVRIDGNLEVNEDPGRNIMVVEQSFLDLPTGTCTVQLRARDEDGEVICTADEEFLIAPEQTSTVEMVLLCNT